jgi:hypothetical protein
MPRKLQACADCKKDCHGLRCTVCAHAQPGGTKGYGPVHASVNSVGGFNAGGGFSTGLALGRCVNPTESEWIGKDREEFQAWCVANRNRMLRGTGGNWRPDAASQYWAF